MEAHAEEVSRRNAAPRAGVSAELIVILAVGVMLGGLVFTTAAWVRDDIKVLRDDVRTLRGDVRAVESDLGELRERVVRIETLLLERPAGDRES